MVWSTPRTYVVGEMITDSILNTHLRDQFNETGPAKVTTLGDLIVGAGANSLKRLGIGAIRRLASVNLAGTDVDWFRPFSTRVYRDTSQTITQNTDTAIQFDEEHWDDGSWHNTVTNNTQIKPSTPCRIICGGHVSWGGDSDLDRTLGIRKNGTQFIAKLKDSNTPDLEHSIATMVQMNGSTDYIELVVRHDAAGTKGVSAADDYSPVFWAQWAGGLT